MQHRIDVDAVSYTMPHLADNILIALRGTHKIAKFIDFGLAVEVVGDRIIRDKKRAGTIEYMAPEIYARQPYSLNVDIWSLGVVVLQVHDFSAIIRTLFRFLSPSVPYR